MNSTQELEAKLSGLRAQYDALFAELLPTATTSADGLARWKDIDIAAWLGFADVDPVRQRVVTHLTGEHANFLVDDQCLVALLTVAQINALLTQTPRETAIRYKAAEIEIAKLHLAELGAAESKNLRA